MKHIHRRILTVALTAVAGLGIVVGAVHTSGSAYTGNVSAAAAAPQVSADSLNWD
jgi:K+-transporting ATPase c subunit